MHSDCRVFWRSDEGLEELKDLLGVTVSESLSADGYARAQIQLPLKYTRADGSRLSWFDRLSIGDHITVVMSNWNGMEGSREVVLDGIITGLSEQETVSDKSYGYNCVVQAASFTHLLASDTVAWWMFWGSVEGWGRVTTFLTPDEQQGQSAEVAFKYLKKVAMRQSIYSNFGLSLERLISLDFAGLNAVAPYQHALTQFEGSHLEIISSFLEAPLQELYTTTDTRLFGKFTHEANPGRKWDMNLAGTNVLRWRPAPYPYGVSEGGRVRIVLNDWSKLRVHTLDEKFGAVSTSSRQRNDSLIRNFFMLYPGVSFATDMMLWALGTVVANEGSYKTFGLRPMKVRTNLLHSENAAYRKESLEDFIERMTWRLAVQHNRLHEMAQGTITTPLMPWVRIGERLRGPHLWHTNKMAEYHIYSRQLSWNPATGGQSVFGVERGLPVEVYSDPQWFARGLSLARVGSETYRKLAEKEP